MPDEINQQAPVQQLAPLSSLEVGAGEGSKSQAPNAALVLVDCSQPEGAASHQSTQLHTKRQGFQELYGRKQRKKTKHISQCHNPLVKQSDTSFLQGWGETGSNAAPGQLTTAHPRVDMGKTGSHCWGTREELLLGACSVLGGSPSQFLSTDTTSSQALP